MAEAPSEAPGARDPLLPRHSPIWGEGVTQPPPGGSGALLRAVIPEGAGGSTVPPEPVGVCRGWGGRGFSSSLGIS